jgi:hypothetical protein
LEIWDEACRVEEELREEMLDVRSWEEESVSRVGASVVAMEPLEVMVRGDLVGRNWESGKKGKGRKGVLKSWNGVRDLANVKVTDLNVEKPRSGVVPCAIADWLETRHQHH